MRDVSLFLGGGGGDTLRGRGVINSQRAAKGGEKFSTCREGGGEAIIFRLDLFFQPIKIQCFLVFSWVGGIFEF